MMAQLSYVHRFEPGEEPGAPPLLLLHGTGGDENDLLPVGRMVAPGAALLSPRGDVLERGMPRFFRRFAEGVFDEDDVRRRADALADFVTDARKVYGIAAPAEADRLKAALEAAGAAVEHRVLPVGHELSQADVTIARQWMQQQRLGENAAAAAVRRTS